MSETVVSWLVDQPNVNKHSLGVYGISWGGSIAWLLNHYDTRLKAVVPIYGCGRHLASGKLYFNNRQSEKPTELARWSEILDGFNFAHQQNAPLFFISATNDFWGWFDTACEMVDRVPNTGSRLSFASNQNHHLDQWAKESLEVWMSHHLKGKMELPANPEVQVKISNQGCHLMG